MFDYVVFLVGDRGFSTVFGWLGLVCETMGDKQLVAVLSLTHVYR